MITPHGTRRVMTIMDAEGVTNDVEVWPAGVAGLGLTPSDADPRRQAWRVIHLGSGIVLTGCPTLDKATLCAQQFGFACKGRQVGALSLITDNADLMRLLTDIARLYG